MHKNTQKLFSLLSKKAKEVGAIKIKNNHKIQPHSVWDALIEGVLPKELENEFRDMFIIELITMDNKGIGVNWLSVNKNKRLNSNDNKCMCCGNTIYTELNPVTMNVQYIVNDMDGCFKDENQSVRVSFPTGELVIADWIRVKEFTEIVEIPKDKRYKPEFSLNSSRGKVNTTLYYAKHHNFISVNVLNTCPDVGVVDNRVVVATLIEDRDCKEYNRVSVTTDLWNVTIIDKEVLTELLTKSGLSKELSKEKIKNLIDNQEVEELRVNKGSYILNFNSSIEKYVAKNKKPKWADTVCFEVIKEA